MKCTKQQPGSHLGARGGVRDIEVTILALVFIVAHVVVYIIH
jgi:hypothetical protein